MRSPGPFSNDTDNLVGELPYLKQLKNKHFSARCVSLLRAGALLHSSESMCVWVLRKRLVGGWMDGKTDVQFLLLGS